MFEIVYIVPKDNTWIGYGRRRRSKFWIPKCWQCDRDI